MKTQKKMTIWQMKHQNLQIYYQLIHHLKVNGYHLRMLEKKNKVPIKISDQNDTSSTELLHDQLEQSGIIVKLIDHDLWQKFHANGTEMIITKAGR